MCVLLTSNQIHKYCYLLYQICSEALERVFGVLSLLDRRGIKHSTSYHIPICQHTMGKLNNRVKSKAIFFPWILNRWSPPKTVPKTLKIRRKIKKMTNFEKRQRKILRATFKSMVFNKASVIITVSSETHTAISLQLGVLSCQTILREQSLNPLKLIF